MRTLKLILLFILIAGNIVLLFNLGSKQYGPEPAAMLSPAEKDKIFEEVLEKKLSDGNDFIETDEAKKIAEKYNERYKGQDPQGTEKEDDGVRSTAPADEVVSEALNISAEQRDADELAKEEAARKNKEEAERRAAEKKAKEEAAKKEAAGAKEKARAEILELVKNKDYKACEKHPGWNTYLTKEERWDVEKVLKPGAKYKNRVIRNTVIKYVNSKVFNGREITWELLKQAREGITKIESNSRYGRALMEGVK